MTTSDCPNCKDGKKCITCDLKDHGFIHKDNLENSFSEFFNKRVGELNQGGNSRADNRDTTGRQQEPKYTIGDVLSHFDDPNCTGGNCPIHKKKNSLIEQGQEIGLSQGLDLGDALRS